VDVAMVAFRSPELGGMETTFLHPGWTQSWVAARGGASKRTGSFATRSLR
jgi:hypothetical protein